MRKLVEFCVAMFLRASSPLARLWIRRGQAEPLDTSRVTKVVVVVAHPDDELLGCGGLLEALPDGVEVVIWYVLGAPENQRLLELEGFAVHHGYDVYLDSPPAISSDALVLTFAPWDGHPDHRTASNRAVDLCLEAGARSVLFFGIFSPITDHLATRSVRYPVGMKSAKMERFYRSQAHIGGAVSALERWQTLLSDRPLSSVEYFFEAAPAAAERWRSDFSSVPQAGKFRLWAYAVERRHQRRRQVIGGDGSDVA